MSVQDIIKKLQSRVVREHLSSHAIRHISIAGSFARGNYTDDSDIDLVVKVDDASVDTDYFSLPRYLETHLGRKIDLIDTDYINKHVKASLLSTTISVW